MNQPDPNAQYNKNEISERISSIEEEIARLILVEKSLEIHKEWDTSIAKIVIIAISTYIFLAVFLWLLGARNVLVDALAGSLAFVISSGLVDLTKKYWVRRYLKANRKKVRPVSRIFESKD